MRKMFVLLIGLSISMQYSSAILNDSTVSIIPKWKTGESKNFIVTQTMKLSKQLNTTQTSDISVVVTDVLDSTIKMKWHIKKIVYLDSTDSSVVKMPLRADLFRIPENVSIEFTLNLKGQIQSIDNFPILKKIYRQRLDSLFDNLDSKYGCESRKSEGAGIFYELFNTEPKHNIFFSELYAFFKLYGIKLSLNSSAYDNEPWVGIKKDEYKINVDKLDTKYLTIKSELMDGGTAVKNGRTTDRVYIFDVSSCWLTYLSSEIKNKGGGGSLIIRAY